MRKKRGMSFGEPIYWTLETLQDALYQISFDKCPGDTLVLLDGCDCCSATDEGGINVRDSVLKGSTDKVITIRKKAGFDYPEDEEG